MEWIEAWIKHNKKAVCANLDVPVESAKVGESADLTTLHGHRTLTGLQR